MKYIGDEYSVTRIAETEDDVKYIKKHVCPTANPCPGWTTPTLRKKDDIRTAILRVRRGTTQERTDG